MTLADNQLSPKLCECGCGGCTVRSDRARAGVKKGEYLRFIHGHNGRRPLRYEVDPLSGCWLWQGALTGAGYGALRRDGVQHLAHRYFYELHRGLIPQGLQLDHLCRVRDCVNPAHLQAVTLTENLRRGAGTKLTAAQVSTIRRSGAPELVLAERFDVSRGAISQIRRGKTWRGVLA